VKEHDDGVAMKETNVQVVIVEDSPTEAMRLRFAVEKAGLNCQTFPDGDQALAFIREHKPPVVLSDVMMPGMDGFQLCSAIKGDAELRGVWVILQTSLTETQHVVQALNSSADYYFTKPVDPDRLVIKLKSLLKQKIDTNQDPKRLTISINDEPYAINSEPQAILNLMVATYENAVQQNEQLLWAERNLKETNAKLVEKFEELEASENRFRAVVETIPDIVYRIDPEGNFIFINSSVEALGYTPDELLGKHFSELIYPTDFDSVCRETVLLKYVGKKH